MDLKLNLPSKQVAEKISVSFVGSPTENRVVIVSPKESDRKTSSGLYVPDTVKEGVPRKGVVVGFGPITDEYITYKRMLNTGDIITYGLYAGKELEPTFTNEEIARAFKDHTFTILSLNEVIYVEPNNQ